VSAGRALRLLLAAGALAACAPEVFKVPMVPPTAPAAQGHADTISLERAATIRMETGYDRVLASGTRWRFAGVVPNGAVYRAAQGVFTLEGANIHEAYLVLRGEELVGFYLPVEQAYSPLKDTVKLSIRNP
jgi:hypothetical protein